jgi:pyridine nucleotide-disulfide oxidoreductase family protein
MKHLLLIGAGHAHAQVLRDWVDAPVPGCELTVVSPSALAPYSGMVPGWLAGDYRFDQICIDFERLAAAAGAQFVIDELAGLDPNRRRVRLRSGAELGYDLLSLNVGSTLTPPAPLHGMRVLSMRPLGELRLAWEALLADPSLTTGDRVLTVTAVGGGPAGVESLLATLARLRALQPGRVLRGRLLTRSDSLLPGLAPGAVRAAHSALASAGVTVQVGQAYQDEGVAGTDLLLWATGAEAHAWQHECGLAISERGFIRVDEHLRSLSHPQVHAVGDCAEWAAPLPKAGVFAVRMGPVLSHNLRDALHVGEPQAYSPQRRYLALLASADGRAIASWGRLSAQGRWVWRWKDHIDRSFLNRFVLGRSTQATTPPRPLPGDTA